MDELLGGMLIKYLVYFSRFVETHTFEKPNDVQGMKLMNEAAKQVMLEFADITLAFGHSDEFRYNLN